MRVSSSKFRVQSLLSILLLCVCSVSAELTVKLEPVEASRFVFEPFTLLLQTADNADMPVVPSGPGCAVTGVMKEPDSGTFRIEIMPEEAGTLTIPPFKVTDGEETVQTPLLRLPVSAPRPADEMTVTFELSATNLVVDQPVELTVRWKSRVPFTRCQGLLFRLPLLRNPAWDVYHRDPDVPEKERIGLPVNAQRVIAQNAQTEEGYELRFSYWLVPRSEGVFPIEARMSCALTEANRSASQYPSYFDNHFFNIPDKRDRFERIYLKADGPQLTVQALPDEGRTVRYSGIVGTGAATADIEPTDTIIGQPMLLTVTLTNLVFGKHIQNLPEATLDGLGPEFKITRDPLHIKSTATSRTFTYIVRPLRSGLTTLPSLALDLFDPKTETYRTLRTQPLPITIEPDGEQTIYTPSKNTEPLIPQNGIRHNRKESEPTMYTLLEFLTARGWIFWALPPLLWLALRPWLRRRDRCRRDPAYARAVHALHRFNRNVKQGETAALKIYLADRFNLTAEAVTFEAVKPHLQNLDKDLLHAVFECFHAEDTMRYAPPGTPAQRAAAARKLVKKIAKAIPVEVGRDRRARRGQLGDLSLPILLLCLLPMFKSDAASADNLFECAMAIRTERPDEAAPLFTEAALEFEHENRFFNAGNSWFFAGRNGRALASYRAAESRRPFDKQIRESIRFIQAQQTDHFQSLENSHDAFSKGWKTLCRWSPALRFGLLTLMYLIAWAIWLAARIPGKTTPCKVWFIYGTTAGIIAFSLVWSFFQPSEGVIIQATDARLGPGYAYQPAYDGILHEAVEFQWLEERDGWAHARLPDDTNAWIRDTACVKVR